MILRLISLTFLFALSLVGAAYADYKNPTQIQDCEINSSRYEFESRKKALDERIGRCLKQPQQGQWIKVPVCDYPAIRLCAPLESQRCQLVAHMNTLREMCVSRFQQWQAKERAKRLAAEQAERERKRFAEQAEREGKKFLQEAVGRAGRSDGIDPGLRPAQNFRKGMSVSRGAAARLVGANLRNAGSLHLSGAVSATVLRLNEAIQTTAIERFREEMAQAQRYNPSIEGNYGTPTPGRREALTEQLRDLQALERQIAHVANLAEQGLPLGGASAVVGEDARHLTEIANAMANGTLRGSLYQMPASEALERIELRRTIEGDREARQNGNRDVFEGVPGNALRQRRGQASSNVRQLVAQHQERAQREAEQRRRAAEERQRRLAQEFQQAVERIEEERRQAEFSSRGTERFSVPDCIKAVPYDGGTEFLSYCPYKVVIVWKSENPCSSGRMPFSVYSGGYPDSMKYSHTRCIDRFEIVR